MIPMKLLRKERSLVLWCFSASLLLSSCGGAGPECGSLDARNSVVKIVSDDTNNKLVNYAVKNSSSVAAMVGDTKSEAEKLEIWEKRDKARCIGWTIQYSRIQGIKQHKRLLALGYCM
jgi:hypothetical protein